ncbi:OsmC-like protein [Daedalea quercina L-15889]|uniref:OsmC-like protein n=1 Tax=Daedalea quercina L-15889 TaxID=1314783 RepID=A0A165LLU8_9APHY|nr:OsmC-like protein [Daedalea quercina L-15889]
MFYLLTSDIDETVSLAETMRPTAAIVRPFMTRCSPRRLDRQAFRFLPLTRTSARSIVTLKDHVYFAKAIAEGSGRIGGVVRSFGDTPLELKTSMPRVAGGKGDAANPEELFSMAYASCFLGSLQLMAARAGQKELSERAKIHAKVFLGHPEDASLEGLGLRIEVGVEGVDDDEIISAAHNSCVYSRALTQGCQVSVVKV